MMTSERPTESASTGSAPEVNNWRYLSDAIETVLALGDFQRKSAQPHSIVDFCKMALGGIDKIAPFDISAIFTIDEASSDLSLMAVRPSDRGDAMDVQVDHLIDEGTVAWAIRERRGITVLSKDGDSQLFLHVIATYARIRGLFIGAFPTGQTRIPDGALELLSLLLRNVATSLESIAYIDLLSRQNQALQKQVEEKMRLLLRHERELANTRKLNAIASLAGGIAHEYNNALMSLMGYGELARLASEDNPTMQKHLARTEPVVERMAQLTNQLLAYSRGGKYREEPIDLSGLVNDTLRNLKANLDESVHVTVAFVLDSPNLDDGPEDDAGRAAGKFTIEGDLNQLHRALTALITNASEAVDADGHIRLRMCRISVEEIPEECATRLTAGEFVLLEIEDDGCGMDQETRERMFEPFFSTKFAGRGLSLAAVSGIVESHHGAILVDSQVARGTIVRLYLPAKHHDPREKADLEGN